jgi:hypothetical protein
MKIFVGLLISLLVGCTTLQPSAPIRVGDERWSRFSDYCSAMKSAIDREWERLAAMAPARPTRNSAFVTFVLDRRGRITRIAEISSTGGEVVAQIAAASITNPAPFGAWSDQMKAELGQEQSFTISF